MRVHFDLIFFFDLNNLFEHDNMINMIDIQIQVHKKTIATIIQTITFHVQKE